MKAFNLTDLDYLPTEQLDEILQEETEKSTPDDDLVLKILEILREREKDDPVELTPREIAALRKYRERICRRKKKKFPLQRWAAAAASVAVVAGLLFAVVPQRAEAETFWEMIQRLSDKVIEFFNRDDIFYDDNYVFETDNEGLQQVYDAVVEMGVTDPVVPMWLPEVCELIGKEVYETPMLKSLYTRFSYNDGEIVYKLDIYKGEPAHQYYKDDSHYESYERNGMVYNITRNVDCWVVVWTKENIECFLTLDCQEDTLQRILESIYVMEDS